MPLLQPNNQTGGEQPIASKPPVCAVLCLTVAPFLLWSPTVTISTYYSNAKKTALTHCVGLLYDSDCTFVLTQSACGEDVTDHGFSSPTISPVVIFRILHVLL